MAKKTKNNTITFDQYLDEIWEDKGEKAYIAAIMCAANAKEGPKRLPKDYWGGYRLSDE